MRTHLQVGSTSLRVRKHVPAPIRVPNVALHGPKVQIHNHPGSLSASATGQGIGTSSASSMSTDDISSVSGTTIARALIANSFVLSSDVRRSCQSHGLSNMLARQDSATLPRGENPFLNSPYWRDKRISGGDIILIPGTSRNSVALPIPPIPSNSNLAIMSAQRSAAGSELRQSRGRPSGNRLFRHPSAPLIPPQQASGSRQLQRSLSVATSSQCRDPRQISRIVELPSPASSAPNTPHKSASTISNGVPTPDSSPSLLAKLLYAEDPSPEYNSSSTPLERVERPPNRRSYSDISVRPTSARSPNGRVSSMSIRNVLDDYMFMSSSGVSDKSFLLGMAPESSPSMSASALYKPPRKKASRKQKNNNLMPSTNSGSVIVNSKGSYRVLSMSSLE